MPIVGRKPEDCFKRFHHHVRRLFEQTLHVPSWVRLDWAHKVRTTTAVLEFTKGDGVSTCLPLESQYGDIHLSVMQILKVVELNRPTRFQLETHEYAYRLIDDPDPRRQAAIRWEYVRDASPRGWPRHHVQSDSQVPLNDVLLNLNRAHTPTGWVTLEELIRFLIHELGVPAKTAEWPTLLAEAENAFFEDFTSKRKHWPMRMLGG